ncbi:helix-turn-helix domain-containing protein [Streptomyces sp. NPDC001982]|uniref:helix-turn-helix domain-containing protein n=1 Tax=Streptomyces sp. NPDC001982 TaxID=3154405 RepID=UPI00331F05D9
MDGVRRTPSLTESRLRGALAADDGALVHRDALVRAGRPESAQVGDNGADHCLTRLRRKPRETDSHLTVATAPGIGHRLS